MAVVGLEARKCTLAVPKVDDCIAIFLDSSKVYLKQAAKASGTFVMKISPALLPSFEK